MDSVNNKVFATSESIAYTSWELFQALMITLGFSVSSTTHTEPTTEELIEEYFGSSYDQWCQSQGEEYEQAMDRNKQLVKDYLNTASDAGACIKQEILSWLPEYVNSEYFHDIISNQASRVVVYDLPNQCNARLDYHFTVNNVPKDLYMENINSWTITEHTAPVYKIITAFYNTSLSRFMFGSVLVSSDTFVVKENNVSTRAAEYVGTGHSVYVAGNITRTDIELSNITWTLTGDGYVLDLPLDDSISQSLMYVKWVDELWEDYVGKDVIWSPTTQDVASDVALDWVDALEGVRDVVIPYTDALEDILAKIRAGLLTWEEAIEALNVRAVDREAEGEIEDSSEADRDTTDEDSKVNENEITLPPFDTNYQGKFDFLKTKFPFCIPFDIVALFKGVSQDEVPPKFHFEYKFKPINYTFVIDIDLEEYEKYIAIFRDGFYLIFLVGLMLVTGKVIKWA